MSFREGIHYQEILEQFSRWNEDGEYLPQYNESKGRKEVDSTGHDTGEA
jgi:hypothetical protein